MNLYVSCRTGLIKKKMSRNVILWFTIPKKHNKNSITISNQIKYSLPTSPQRKGLIPPVVQLYTMMFLGLFTEGVMRNGVWTMERQSEESQWVCVWVCACVGRTCCASVLQSTRLRPAWCWWPRPPAPGRPPRRWRPAWSEECPSRPGYHEGRKGGVTCREVVEHIWMELKEKDTEKKVNASRMSAFCVLILTAMNIPLGPLKLSIHP